MSHTPTASPAKLIKIAKAEVGYHEGKSGGHWNNHEKYAPAVPSLGWAQNQAWCATFVSWVATQAGFGGLFPITASTDTGARWFKNQKRWSEYPAIGAQVFYGSNGDMNHTGLVYDYDDTYIYTVEGNTNSNGSAEGDGVYLKKRARRDDYVQGYGYPKFSEGIVSADPAWAKQAPKPAKAGKHKATKAQRIPAPPAKKEVTVSAKKTRIQKFRDGGPKYDMSLLDAAVKGGRVGTVKIVRDDIDAQIARLPHDHDQSTRVHKVVEDYVHHRILRMGALHNAIKGGRTGTVKEVRDEIRRLIDSLPKK